MKLINYFCSLLVLGMTSSVFAEVSLPAIIDSGMILQSGASVPVWGWAEPHERVTVTFAGQTEKTEASSQGKWMVRLKPLKVSNAAREMTIQGKNLITLKNVLVGEVWLASGQSNMEYSLGAVAKEEQDIAFKLIDNQHFRMFCIPPKVRSSLPLEDTAGYWSDCSFFIKQLKNKKIKGYDSHSAVGFFFGLKLQQDLNVPVAVIDSSWGGTRIESWIADEGYEMEGIPLREINKADDSIKTDFEDLSMSIKEWRESAYESIENHQVPTPQVKTKRSKVVNSIYNGMIAPLAPFAIRGTVWYQGEANRGSKDYFQKLKALTGGWSKVFGVQNMPFYLVQLAPYNYAHSNKSLSAQLIHDSVVSAQYKAAEAIQGCDVINISDTVFGDVRNVHPKHKKTVGDRLAALALHHDYGKEVVCSGPKFASATLRGKDIVVNFDRIDQGLETNDGKAPNWLEVAGADEVFYEATAKIEKNRLVVSCLKVSSPKFIRMAWNNIAEQNLRDKNGWPAFSFNAEIKE